MRLLGFDMPAFRVVNYAVATEVDSTTLVMTVPAGTLDGDLLLAFAFTENASKTWTVASGWTEAADSNGLALARRTASSEPSSYVFERQTPNALENNTGVMVAIRGAAFDVAGAVSSGSTTPTSPSVTMSAEGLLLAFYGTSTGSTGGDDNPGHTFPAPTGMSAIVRDSDADNPSFGLFMQRVAVGATGTRASSSATLAYGILAGVIAA